MDAQSLATGIREFARQIGFDLVGVARVEPSHYREYVRDWLDQGKAGSMNYLSARFEERTDPAVFLPGARSAICVAMNYFHPLDPPPQEADAVPGRIARYALGDDYHEVMKDRLHRLADWIRTQHPGATTKSAVDTAPILERELAVRAGLGWLAKNTCIIHPKLGSWLLLGEILTTLELPPDPPETDHCGTCRRCLDACPTQAFTAPYKLDPRRCISYLTIEHRGEISTDLKPLIGDWLYGCDICQDVCPHNREVPAGTDSAFLPRFPSGTLNARRILDWTIDDYRSTLRHSAIKRVKLPQLQRNAEIVIKNAERPGRG